MRGMAHIDHAQYSQPVGTERISLTMDSDALAAARAAAQAEGVSLSAWISRAARDRAIERAARVSAEQDRRLGGEFAEWDAQRADRLFGDAA
jgi:hypothetical protein